MTKLHAAIVMCGALSLILAIGTRYAESQSGFGPPILSPIYAHAIGSALPSDSKPDREPTLRPLPFYQLSEASAILATFLVGLGLSLLASIFSFLLLRKGYDVWAMLGLVFSVGTAAIWDIAIGAGLSALFLGVTIYAKFTTDA